MDDLRTHLNDQLLADGAMGTQLLALGLEGECPEAWNLEHADAVTGVHARYVDAGARFLCTNSFGASAWKLARSGHAEQQEALCRAAFENAATAAAGRVWVLGDVGPTGELPEPYGPHTIEEFEAIFADQIGCLVDAGVHGIIIETMASAAEAAAAVRAARRTCDLPVFACMTYAAGKAGYRTMMGETVAAATETLLEAGADVVGSNCGLGTAAMMDVVGEIRAVTDGPVFAKPNAGVPKLVDGRTVFDETADTWAPNLPRLVEAGANIVGGCCGTSPEHIAQAARLLGER